MDTFTHLRAVAAPIEQANIDTDQILPGRFLKTVQREGLGRALFHSLRYDGEGHERPEFILNRDPWLSAGILIGLDNFGCGSSREHAPWALTDFGIRAILAPGFADIFRNNCCKNGILPIVLPRATIDTLIAEAYDPATATIEIDLPEQTVVSANGAVFGFDIAPESKEQLLLGLDEIAASERALDRIAAFEAQMDYCCPSITGAFDDA